MRIGLIINNLIFHNFFVKIVAVTLPLRFFEKRKASITGSTVDNQLLAVKVEKKVYLLEGQTGEILLYDKTSIESKNFERGYRQFKYTKAGKIKK